MKLAARVDGFLGLMRRLGVRRTITAAIAGIFALGSASSVLLYAAHQGARAQVWAGYYNSAHNTSGLPGFRLSLQYTLVSPDSTDLATVYGTPSSPVATAPSARITTLARSLENDPDRIFQFVHNTILFEPQFGLHKGADGVLLDGAGGSFDQSQLMVELLRASGYQARFVLGKVSLSGAEAKSILRVETGRQACILLATAGTPATINGGTVDCGNLGAPLTDVQMLHVWVEAEIGGTWYAFDPSLKATNKIAGIDIWSAAGTTSSSAWSNVSSGVSVGSGSLNGVNAQNIQNDVAGYATTLQNSLIANHSDKSLKQLAGGWEIVRTEAQPRNVSLPRQVTVATRWAGDVPSPYRATLRIQTAGFDHTFDLPSIYGWRVQAQLQGRSLKVAVRKQEHIDAAATAYFSGQCDGIDVVCGTDPGLSAFDVQNRRIDLSINHPYAARRTGNPQPPIGTFGDETVSKTIEIGKRADILVRTAGGRGERKAAWAAANDPIQMHRIIPAGDDYNNCVAMDDDTAIQDGECDGQNAVDWRYWVPTAGFFPVGEVAAAEMGTKKDALLNTWTDLFDKTVALVEPMSGARIFHQHSIGIAMTPGYAENVLDIDTSVGIAADGTDQPHHILSALASLGLTEEALAIGQMATERPMFQGSSFQATAARRMAIGTGLKVLTAPGSTTSLPGDVSADTRATIEAYLNKGFSVVATTAGTENAFLARRNDGSEQAWIMRMPVTETNNPTPIISFRKGAGTETPNPVDYLGKAESRRIAANVAGTLLGAVDLRTGTLSFSEGSELSMGQGEFPYSLSFSRSYVSTGPVEGQGGLGMGWTHNWESSVSHSTDVGALLPQAETVTAAPMLVAVLIALEAGRADTLEAAAVAGIALDGLQEQVAYNVINVNGGGQSGRFVRLVDGTWRNPASPTESIAAATGPLGAYTSEVNWTLADRSVMTFRDMDNPYSGTNPLGRKGIHKTWTFPTGVVITLNYGGHDGTNRPELTSVTNNLGAALTFTYTQNQSSGANQQCNTIAAQTFPNFQAGYREAVQACYEQATRGGRLIRVQAGPDEVNFTHESSCPQFVNFCAFQLTSAQRPGLRTRQYIYTTPTDALLWAYTPMDYQQVLTEVIDAGVATPRARFDWRATGGQVAPYVAEVFDAQNRKTTYYSSTFTYSSAKDASNAVIRQSYDEDGRLATSADAMGRTSRATYDGPGRSKLINTPWGDQTSFLYDARGNLIERTQTPIAGCATGLGAEEQAWWCQTITIKAQYDTTWNKPTRITQPATAADPQERHWDLTYNVKGLVETMTGPAVQNGLAGGVSMEQPVWRTWYDPYGRVNLTRDPTGIESSMTYGGGGLPAFCLRIQTVSSQSGGIAGLTTTQACDAVGNVTSVTDARGHTTTTGYDTLRRKVSETGPAGTAIQTQWVYDLNGDQVQTKQWDSTAATWRTTATVFSATHQPLTVTDPSGDVARTCYDTVDRPVTVIDGEHRATHTIYNAAGQPTEIHRFQRAAAGSCSLSTELPPNAGFSETRWRRYEYNAAGMQSAEIDARGNSTQQQYDGLGRAAKTLYADGAEAWTAMDERGQAVFRRQRGGSRAAIFYDAIGRDFHVREFDDADKTYMFKGRNSRASYDLAGRPVWRDVSSQTTLATSFDDALTRDIRNYGYDPAGRMTSEQWRPEGVPGISFTTGYGYDLAGNRTSVTWPAAWTATYAYDAANRIQTVSFPGAGGTQTVTLSHDSLSRRTGIDRPGAAADTSYTYEPDSDLASLSHAFVPGAGPGAVSFSYSHDAAGKTTGIGINQPAFEWMPTVAYARTYGVANVLNQVASEAGVPIMFNPDGNMTSDGVNTYSWTWGNRMAGASRAGMTATYDYDSDDRRTKKTVNGVVTRTLWSGADELAEYDVNGDLLRRFVPDGSKDAERNPTMDARLATVTPAGAVYWHHVDHQGSVIATSDSAGQTVGTASYSPFGEFGAGVSTTPQHSPFGYTGRQYDPETGLYQYRARYYSPRLGQFLSMDPIGTKDDPNLYLYVANDPVNNTDPTGKCPLTACPDVVVEVDGQEVTRIPGYAVQGGLNGLRQLIPGGLAGAAILESLTHRNERSDEEEAAADEREYHQCVRECVQQYMDSPDNLPGEGYRDYGPRLQRCIHECRDRAREERQSPPPDEGQERRDNNRQSESRRNADDERNRRQQQSPRGRRD
tara:strand:+ start:29961 stop:36506 length:6546 start_codon:yes stop_codon:yes gene_type:complete